MSITTLSYEYATFLENLKTKVYESQYQAARKVNKELILLYHHIGTEILKRQKEQGWGTKVIDQLSQDLRHEFSEDNCFGRVRLCEVCDDFNIFQTLFGKLIWRLLKLLSPLKNETARSFHAFLIGCVQEALAQLLRYSSNLPLLGNNVKGEKEGNFSSKVLETYWGILLLPLTALSVQMKPLQSKNLFVKERNTHP